MCWGGGGRLAEGRGRGGGTIRTMPSQHVKNSKVSKERLKNRRVGGESVGGAFHYITLSFRLF